MGLAAHLRDAVQRLLGTHAINQRIPAHLRRQEVMLARLCEQVTALNQQRQHPEPDSREAE